MGESDDNCDNGVDNIDVDFILSRSYEYMCESDDGVLTPTRTTPLLSCLENQEIPKPLHQCLGTDIEYEDDPPRGGPHRPLWPRYGEYVYCPPQRWVHSIEHGAVVFLYHPCADPIQVDLFKSIIRSCLRRHIITPYRNLPLEQPFALMTYGCKLTMSHVRKDVVVQFILENAMNERRASEATVWKDGQYSYGLLQAAKVVPGSDKKDSRLCPRLTSTDDDTTDLPSDN